VTERRELEQCAVCGADTDNRKHWGRHVCSECIDRPVLFAVSCGVCGWSTTKEGIEYKRGQAKQAAQREGNSHQDVESFDDESPDDHPTAVWEMDHPDREQYIPSEEDDTADLAGTR
jgi:hypothetical protein